jgi:hypothetical protein
MAPSTNSLRSMLEIKVRWCSLVTSHGNQKNPMNDLDPIASLANIICNTYNIEREANQAWFTDIKKKLHECLYHFGECTTITSNIISMSCIPLANKRVTRCCCFCNFLYRKKVSISSEDWISKWSRADRIDSCRLPSADTNHNSLAACDAAILIGSQTGEAGGT